MPGFLQHGMSGIMNILLEADITCPYCMEEILVLVDPSAGERQDYVEDCQVCCRPIDIAVDLSEGEKPRIRAERNA